MRVGAIHDDAGYRFVREMLSRQYSLSERDPDIQVTNVDMTGDRALTLQHFIRDRKPLAQEYKDVMKQLAWLWGFKVKLDGVSEDGSIQTLHEVMLDTRRRRPDGRQIAAMRRP